MKRRSALFFQAAVVLVGIGALAFLLWEPHIEGRNVHATTFEIYFNDPFLAYAYAGAVPFFWALHRAFRLFGHAGRRGAFSPETVDGLRFIKHCGMAMIGFVVGGVVLILLFGDRDDRPAGVFMSFLVAIGSGGIAAGAAMLGRKVEGGLRRSEGGGG